MNIKSLLLILAFLAILGCENLTSSTALEKDSTTSFIDESSFTGGWWCRENFNNEKFLFYIEIDAEGEAKFTAHGSGNSFFYATGKYSNGTLQLEHDSSNMASDVQLPLSLDIELSVDDQLIAHDKYSGNGTSYYNRTESTYTGKDTTLFNTQWREVSYSDSKSGLYYEYTHDANDSLVPRELYFTKYYFLTNDITAEGYEFPRVYFWTSRGDRLLVSYYGTEGDDFGSVNVKSDSLVWNYDGHITRTFIQM